ncbi:CHD3-type chromatin-remodeling factor PICKLE-like isoform X2 [Tripterygium wilfordii]|uniref:CHD3-type chromatin-remodeling factor PICKLE-like isoform X2 n=1 Tax=Tripterygium wilfordii TaxID=458696 RepID=UPI0018F86197|nr:CHD3-type chromatin-remodeling factor PICKLE-like isoform X2 [Tripterygium wilfordii]
MCAKMASVEVECIDGFEDVSSALLVVDATEPVPLMEGEGSSLRVLGFDQCERIAFVKILMRFGIGNFYWKKFAGYLKQKTVEEIQEYGKLFLSHIVEDITELPTFSDGIPKEGLDIEAVHVRIGVLMSITDKVKFLQENPGASFFSKDIVQLYPELKHTRFWKEEHDLLLLLGVMKHGYKQWLAIVDGDATIREAICEELNLSFRNSYGVEEAISDKRLYQAVFIKERFELLEKGLGTEEANKIGSQIGDEEERLSFCLVTIPCISRGN